MSRRDVFIAVHGQDDNLGDSVLRRPMVDAARSAGHRLQVLVGRNSPEYCSALGLAAEDVLYASRAEWTRAAAAAAVRGQAHLVSNAGEIQLNRRRVRILLSEVALLALVGARGGQRLATGLGVRAATGPRVALLRLWTRLFGLVSWRDAVSAASAGGRGVVSPDWSLILGSPVEDWRRSEDRPLLALSFRGDRPALPPEAVDEIRRSCERFGLEPVVVTQVSRDGEQNDALATALGARHLRPGSDRFEHGPWEQVVREAYQRSRFAYSDRLHVLLLAATEGAIPVGPSADPKIHRTFEAAGVTLHDVAAIDDSSQDQLRMLGLEIDRARQGLSALATTMASRLTKTRARGVADVHA